MKKKLTPAYPSLKMCHKKLSTALGNKLLWLMKTRKAHIKRSEVSGLIMLYFLSYFEYARILSFAYYKFKQN